MKFLAALCLSAVATVSTALKVQHQKSYIVTGTPGISVDPSEIKFISVSDD